MVEYGYAADEGGQSHSSGWWQTVIDPEAIADRRAA
jgi:hypothetical protein